jgi:hypothetical protein
MLLTPNTIAWLDLPLLLLLLLPVLSHLLLFCSVMVVLPF